MAKKIITLSLGDLKDLGIIPRKEKKRKRRTRRKKVYVDARTGAIIGGPKSDSNHMQGFGITSSNPQFLNSANLNTEIQQANLEEIRNRSNPLAITEDRFTKPPVLSIEDVKNNMDTYMKPFMERTTDEFGRIQNTIDRGVVAFNQLQNQVYNPFQYSLQDNAFATETAGSEYFKKQGNAPDYTTPKKQYEDNDIGSTPANAPESLIKELRSIENLNQSSFANLVGQANNEDDPDYEEIPELEEPKSILDLQIIALELLTLKSSQMAGSTYANYTKKLKSDDINVLEDVINKLNNFKSRNKKPIKISPSKKRNTRSYII